MSQDTRPSFTHSFNEGDNETSGGPTITLFEETDDISVSELDAPEETPSIAGESNVEQLKKRVTSHENRIRQLESEMKEITSAKSEMKQQFEEDIQKLQGELVQQKKMVKSLQERIEKLEKANDDLKGELLKSQTGLDESERRHDLLYITQAATLFERAICTHVLPVVFQNDKFATIRRLLNYLNGGIALPIRGLQLNKDEIIYEAKQKWAEVCNHLGLPDEWKTEKVGNDIDWSDANVPEIIGAIYFLKNSRLAVAHPTKISLEKAKQKVSSESIVKDMTPTQHDMVKTLIFQLKENIEKIGLQFPDEELTS